MRNQKLKADLRPQTHPVPTFPNGMLGERKLKSTCNFTSKEENLKLTLIQ